MIALCVVPSAGRMAPVSAVANQTRNARVICRIVALVFFPLLLAHAQSQQAGRSATLRGTVRDWKGNPVSGATVHLQTQDGVQDVAAATNSQGNYAFAALRSGAYSLRAEGNGSTAIVPSIFLGPQEAKNVDLTLAPAKAPASPSNSTAAPKFYDQPQFTVSGVADTTGLGGHGSDTVVRTREMLAKETVSLGKAPAAPQPALAAMEKSLREGVEREPSSFEANHRLGVALVQNGKAREAIRYLERAAQLKPDDYENAYNLALANADGGNYDAARKDSQDLLAHYDKAEIHHLLGDVQEKLGNSLEAVREYQLAAEADPSEVYLFDWGSELLLHHAPEPALEVFSKGNRLYPRSVRMLIGMGASWFARGSYEQAVQRICEASDLDPGDAMPYLFLGKMDRAESATSDALVEKLRRFATLHPESAEANYYYAGSLWKRRKNADGAGLTQVESLLNNAIRLNPEFGAAHLQLGILHAERREFSKAITDYEDAIHSAPQMEEAHYRLAQAYREVGDAEKAKAEIETYERMSKESAQKAEAERHEIRQFVYTLRDRGPTQIP